MCLLLESICVEHGDASLLHYHEQRMNRSRQDLWGSQPLNLQEMLAPQLSQYRDGLYKCRVLYQQDVKQVEFVPYQRPQINSLQKVYSQDIDYSYKSADRKALSELYQQRKSSDDILIIKNGVVTDSYFANVLFAQGDQWYTSDQPLLKGVQRQWLLDHGRIKAKRILEEELSQYTHFKLVNALNSFEYAPSIEIQRIYG